MNKEKNEKENTEKLGKEVHEEKLATALEYDKKKGTPKVVASGKGNIAEKIINKAKKENISIYQDKELASLMKNLDVGSEVPESLYNVVAQILVFVSDMDIKVRDKIMGK